MEITSLSRLIKEGGVTCNPEGLIVTIHPSWVVEGEDRLSYTTLIRLIECCREHHWQIDVLPRAGGTSVDSICKSLTAKFTNAIPVGSVLSITYRVTGVRQKGYSLRFEVRDTKDQKVCAEFDLVSVFYDPVARKPTAPPASVFDHLSSLCSQL